MRVADLGLQEGGYKSLERVVSPNMRKYSKYLMGVCPRMEQPDAGGAPWPN